MDLLQLLSGLMGGRKPQRKPMQTQGLSMRPPWEGNYQIQGQQAPQTQQPDPIQQLFQPNAVRGAINPVWQAQRGYTPYSPGEGPRTRNF